MFTPSASYPRTVDYRRFTWIDYARKVEELG